MPTIFAYCSWCYEETMHFEIKSNWFRRNVYCCQHCGNYTLKCRYCKNMAKGKPGRELEKKIETFGQKLGVYWDNELCAEHDGTIASFERLRIKLDDITRYHEIFRRDKKNLAKLGKVSGGVLLGVLILSTAGTGTPAAIAGALGKMGLLGAASTGTAISTLSGAALTSASLAAIGGTVSGGVLIISAVGVSLGGVIGGVVANTYVRAVKDFDIIELSPGGREEHAIFINGFLQQKDRLFEDWCTGHRKILPNATRTGITWESKTLLELGTIFSNVGGKRAIALLGKKAKQGTKQGAKQIRHFGKVLTVADLLTNPLHVSMVKAAQTGALVSDAIARCDGQTFTLIGHSLGCRVIYYVLSATTSWTLFCAMTSWTLGSLA